MVLGLYWHVASILLVWYWYLAGMELLPVNDTLYTIIQIINIQQEDCVSR